MQINCFKKLRFLAEIITKCIFFFANLRTITQDRIWKLDKWPKFFYLLFELCLSHSFLYLKIAKTQLHLVPAAIHFAQQNTWISNKRYLFGQAIKLFQKLDISEDTKNPYVLSLDVRRKKLLSHAIMVEIDIASICFMWFNLLLM